MIQEHFNYIRITYSRDLAEAEGFAWHEDPEKPLNSNMFFFHMVCGPADAALCFYFFNSSNFWKALSYPERWLCL